MPKLLDDGLGVGKEHDDLLVLGYKMEPGGV